MIKMILVYFNVWSIKGKIIILIIENLINLVFRLFKVKISNIYKKIYKKHWTHYQTDLWMGN